MAILKVGDLVTVQDTITGKEMECIVTQIKIVDDRVYYRIRRSNNKQFRGGAFNVWIVDDSARKEK